jgi:hypothetical protein
MKNKNLVLKAFRNRYDFVATKIVDSHIFGKVETAYSKKWVKMCHCDSITIDFCDNGNRIVKQGGNRVYGFGK